jgi:hypothetical protein
MNKILPFVFLLIFFISLFSCRQNNITAKQYHDQVYASVDTVVKYVFKLDNDLRSNAKEAKKSYDLLLQLTNDNLKFVQEKGSYENKDDKMQKASIDILTYYKTYTEKDFQLALEIVTKDSVSESAENQVLEIINRFYDGESNYLDQFKKESYDFGDRYKIYKVHTGTKN